MIRNLFSTTFRILGLLLCLLIPVSVLAFGYFSNFFSTAEIYTTGREPLDVTSADLNSDGHLDVVTANREGRSLSVFMGNGDGTLTEISKIEVGLGATSLAVADIDLDEIPDIVATVCNSGCTENAIHIYRGLGDGLFELDQEHSLEGVPYNVLLHDFDGDSLPDIAASDAAKHRVILLLSKNRAGEFAVQQLPTGKRPITLAMGDLDGNGKMDLVTANQRGDSVTLYLSDQDGTFQDSKELETSNLPYSVAISDVSGDGVDDLLLAHSSEESHIDIFFGNPAGQLTLSKRIHTDGRLIFIYAEDFNDDELLDIAVTAEAGTVITVYLNSGAGDFELEPMLIPAGHRIYSLQITDLNGDPYPDLLTVEFAKNQLSVAVGKNPSAYE